MTSSLLNDIDSNLIYFYKLIFTFIAILISLGIFVWYIFLNRLGDRIINARECLLLIPGQIFCSSTRITKYLKMTHSNKIWYNL